MKTSLFSCILALVGQCAWAQLKIAPEIGANLYKQTSKVSSPLTGNTTVKTTDYQLGARAGAVLTIDIDKHFSIQPGLFYVLGRTKRHDRTPGRWGTYYDTYITQLIHAAQAPVYAVYRTGAEGKGHFFLGLGGYFTFHIGGWREYEGPLPTFALHVVEKNNLKFEGDYPDLRRFDFGPSLMAGYQLACGLYVKGQYDHGLANIGAPSGGWSTLKSTSFALSLGYAFGRSGKHAAAPSSGINAVQP